MFIIVLYQATGSTPLSLLLPCRFRINALSRDCATGSTRLSRRRMLTFGDTTLLATNKPNLQARYFGDSLSGNTQIIIILIRRKVWVP
jgi:hypothetical protein